jgi:hypothetical protein
VYICYYFSDLAYKQLLFVLPPSLALGIISALLYFLHYYRTKRLTYSKLNHLSFFLAYGLILLLALVLSVAAFSDVASLRPGSALSVVVLWFMPAYVIPVLAIGYFIGWIIEIVAVGKLKQSLAIVTTKKFLLGILFCFVICLYYFAVPFLLRFNIIPLGSIYYAAQTGNIRQVKRFLDNGVNVNQSEDDDYKKTPLHMATYSHEKMVEFLISEGAEINSLDAAKQTPLHTASGVGNYDVVEVLIQYGAMVNAQDKHGNTPLYKAARRGHLDVVILLLEKGADVNLKNLGDQSPIFVSVWYNYPEITQVFLKNGADINIRDKKNRNLLSIAQDKGFHKIEKMLQMAGKNKERKIKDGN